MVKCCWSTFVLAGMIGYVSALNQGYENCLQGTGQQKPLLLQDGRRCVQVQPEVRNWADGMNLCNSRQGHLLHTYSSDEVQLVNDWLVQLSLPYDSWIGSKKLGPLNGNFTGYNIRWMTSVSTDIGIDQTYQYVSTRWEHDSVIKLDDRTDGCTWSSPGSSQTLYGHGSFCVQTVTNVHVLCQFLSDRPPPTNFQRYKGKRSLAPVYETFDDNHSTMCGVVCSRSAWCLGFNGIESGSKTSCQLISFAKNDTQMGITHDNNVNYYERIYG